MKPTEIRKMVITALLTALTMVSTYAIRVPTPTGGYVNLGDTAVLLSAFLLGPLHGMVAGGVGSAVADLWGGYVAWAPATLVIKGAMGLVTGLVYRWAGHRKAERLIAGLCAETIMVGGYFFFEAALLGQGSGAAAGIPANLVQAAFGIAAAIALTGALRRSGYVRKKYPGLL